MRSLNSILNQLGIKTKSGRPVLRYKSSSKVLTHNSILHILTAFISLLIVFTPLLAQAANYLEGTAYNQNNKGTSAGGSFSGSILQTYNFTTIDLTNEDPGGQGDHYSFVIEGFVYASVAGTYQFETYTDDGIRVIVDGTLVINNWTDHGPTINTGSINLLTGWIPVRIEHYEKGGGQVLRFRWKPPGDSSFSYPTAADLSNGDLPDPTNSNTTLVASPTSVVANGSTTSSVTVTLADANGNLLSASGGTVALSSTGSATISAVTDNANGTYTATVTNTVAESVTISGTLDGAAITDTATIAFIDAKAPTLLSSTPSDNASNVELDQNIILNFSEDVVAGSGSIKLFGEDGLLVESFTVSSPIISGSTITLNPTTDLNYNFAYYIQVPATAIKDTAGNTYAGITNNTALNFITRQKTPKEGFAEIQDEISTTMKSNTNKQINIFVHKTKTTISFARNRFISNRIINSRSNLADQTSKDSIGVGTDNVSDSTNFDQLARASSFDRHDGSSFNLRSSTRGTIANGKIQGIRQSDDGKITHFTGTQFNYTKSENSAETRSTSSQFILERKNSDNLTTGRFIGSSLSKYSKIDENTKDIGAVIESVSLQFGGYFVHNISNGIFLDGYLAGSLVANKLEFNTTSITAESNYVSRLGATGLAATGSLPFDSWEIRPTLGFDYSAVSSQYAKFEVTSEAGDSNELVAPSNVTQLSFVFSPDIRKTFDFKEGNWSKESILSFKPQVTCQRVTRDTITSHCGQGASLSFTMQDKDAMKTLGNTNEHAESRFFYILVYLSTRWFNKMNIDDCDHL